MLVVVHRLGRTAVCFPLLKARMVPSSTMKARPQGGGFQVSSSSETSGPMSKVHAVFSNGDLTMYLDYIYPSLPPGTCAMSLSQLHVLFFFKKKIMFYLFILTH